jgi:hypothetical protein
VTPELRLEATDDESPPKKGTPQVTTEPSAFSAAKASRFEYKAVTPELRLEATDDESPPKKGTPQVTTEPLEVIAAKAPKFGTSWPFPLSQILPEAVVKLPNAPR